MKMVQALPLLSSDGECFCIDLRLKEFRDMADPSMSIDFISEKGLSLCDLAGVVTCHMCGTAVIVSGIVREKGFCCVNCLEMLE